MVWVPHMRGGGGRHVGKVLEHQKNTAVEIDNLSKSNRTTILDVDNNGELKKQDTQEEEL